MLESRAPAATGHTTAVPQGRDAQELQEDLILAMQSKRPNIWCHDEWGLGGPRWSGLVSLLAISLAVLGGCGGGGGVPPSSELIVQAREALAAGDRESARKILDQAVEADQSVWALAMRARMHAEDGDDAAATADCEAGLAVDQANFEIRWVLEELKKPTDKRFQDDAPLSTK